MYTTGTLEVVIWRRYGCNSDGQTGGCTRLVGASSAVQQGRDLKKGARTLDTQKKNALSLEMTRFREL